MVSIKDLLLVQSLRNVMKGFKTSVKDLHLGKSIKTNVNSLEDLNTKINIKVIQIIMVNKIDGMNQDQALSIREMVPFVKEIHPNKNNLVVDQAQGMLGMSAMISSNHARMKMILVKMISLREGTINLIHGIH